MAAVTTMTELYSIERGTSAQTIAKIFEILLPDIVTVLDLTYGHGKFWLPQTRLYVTGHDIDPRRSPGGKPVDFYATGYPDDWFDAVVFDPPYHTDSGDSIMRKRFGSFETMDDLTEAVTAGCQEACRVARKAVVVKVQDYVHGQRLVMMSDMVREAVKPAYLYDIVHGWSERKVSDPRWQNWLSARKTHASYWVFRLDSPVHKVRKPGRRRPMRVMPKLHTRKSSELTRSLRALLKADSPYAHSVVTAAPTLPGFDGGNGNAVQSAPKGDGHD